MCVPFEPLLTPPPRPTNTQAVCFDPPPPFRPQVMHADQLIMACGVEYEAAELQEGVSLGDGTRLTIRPSEAGDEWVIIRTFVHSGFQEEVRRLPRKRKRHTTEATPPFPASSPSAVPSLPAASREAIHVDLTEGACLEARPMSYPQSREPDVEELAHRDDSLSTTLEGDHMRARPLGGSSEQLDVHHWKQRTNQLGLGISRELSSHLVRLMKQYVDDLELQADEGQSTLDKLSAMVLPLYELVRQLDLRLQCVVCPQASHAHINHHNTPAYSHLVSRRLLLQQSQPYDSPPTPCTHTICYRSRARLLSFG